MAMFLLDNDVRHLASCFPSKQTLQLEDVGLPKDADDPEIVEIASGENLTIITNNRRHFESDVAKRIAESSKKENGCTQVHGLVIVLPSERLKQERAIQRAANHLTFNGKHIGWKDVHKLCLKVIIEESGKASVSKLPRCPHCVFDNER